MLRLLSLAALLSAVLLLPGLAGGSETMARGQPRVTLFGDSVAGALAYVPEARALLAQGVDLRLELAPCRKLVTAGCPYQGTRPPSVLDIVQASSPADLGNIVVVDVGYNEPANNYDTDMAQVVNALLARGVGYIVWVTMREQDDDYRTINQIIRAEARRVPQLQVADWNAASQGQDWFQADGLHLNAAGALGLAALLRPYILAACGSACAPPGPPPAQAPRSVRAPTLAGIPIVGRTLRCLPGAWSGTRPLRLSYRWLRGGRVLVGAHGTARRLVARDAGAYVACRVWASNTQGVAQATSRPLQVRRGHR